MLVKSMQTLAGVRDSEPLTAAYRARLRTRTLRTAALNSPTMPPEVIPVTTVDGARLRVHAYGPADGEVLVLIHGWSCSIEYWNPQINAFADRYRVIAYDQRGHGESSLGTAPPSDSTLADDLATVLDAALPRGRRAVLAGHSMGGITLQAWAAHYPEQVAARASAVVLLNTTSGDIRRETDLFPLMNRPLTVANRPVTVFGNAVRLPQFIGETVLSLPVPLPDIWPVRSVFKARVMSPPTTDEEVDFALGVVRSCRPLTRGLYAAALAGLELGDAAVNLTVPTTVIAGAIDHLLPERMNRPIVAALRRAGTLANYHVWPTGHLGNIEAAARFNAELHRILTSATDYRAAAV
ncbi:alpha/beta fold hydrolase [Nocardia arthritidis]|uniref:Alpha/beta fold hydrolase n=1 Tax=Nocardia arthritidis TaxID=228602 RepID=A0A6G9Y5J0_9NOCA|nr:alpha/beta hydrolase [Nocardia arthritidis]QIS08336.1 alpha/beta fold hydrolase [Nocardia arthritidis]